MENIGNNENRNPKSLGRIGYNTAFKNNFQFKNNIKSKNQNMGSRTPLKSKINLMSNNPQPLNSKDNKCLKYPLLKSVSHSNINYSITNNSVNNIYIEENEKYNENALEDEPEDFIHMNEDEINIYNTEENYDISPNKPKINFNYICSFKNNLDNNYTTGGHFDDEEKEQFNDYFNSPDEDEINDSDNKRLS